MTQFLESAYYVVEGSRCAWSDFRSDFLASLPPRIRADWTDARIIAELPAMCPVGRGPRNQKIIGNLTRQRRRVRRWVAVAGGQVRLEA